MNQQPISSNRIVLRHNLFEQLDHSRRGQITWLNANAGSGKSTVVNSYIHHREIPHLWYQVRQEDSNVARIFAQISNISCGHIDQNTYLPAYQPDLHLDLSAFCSVLFKRLFSALPEDCYLVFEDFHLSEAEAEFSFILNEALLQLHPKQHILVTSRETPPPYLMHNLAKATSTIINNHQLKFTLHEIENLLGHYNLTNLSTNDIEKLRDDTDGWISGIVLILSNFIEHGELITHFETGHNTYLFQYFTGLIFSSLIPHEQQCLLQLSLAPFITPELVGSLEDLNCDWYLLETLVQKNFFVSILRNPENAIKLHDLFREYLLKRAINTLPTALINQQRLTIANHLSEMNFVDEAIDLYRECGRFDKIQQLIINNGFEKLKHGKSKSLDKWLSNLPKKTIKSNAQLCLLKGCTLAVLNPSYALEYLEYAFRTAMQGDNHLITAKCWSSYINFLAIERLDTRTFGDELIKLEQHFNGTLNHQDSETRFYLLDGVVTVNAYTGYLDQRVNMYLDIAEQYVYEAKEIDHTANMFRSLFIAFAFYGDHKRAIRLNRFLSSEMMLSSMAPYTLFMLALNLIEETHFYPNSKKAREWLNALKQLRSEHAWTNCSMQIESAEAYQALLANQPDKAANLIEPYSKNTNVSNPVVQSSCIFMESWLATLQGDYPRAIRKTNAALSLIGDKGVAQGQVALYLLRGFAAAATNAQTEYTECLNALKKWHFSHSVCKSETLFLQSYWHLTQNDHELAKEYLQKAIAISADMETAMIMGIDHKIRAELLMYALDNNIETDYTNTLIGALDLNPPKECNDKSWPWKVKIYTQGSLTIHINGTVLEFDRSPQKALELIQALIIYGCENVPLTKLADTLWPDLDGLKSNNNVHVAINRARNVFGNDVILVSNKKASLNSKRCWVDRLMVQKWVEQSEILRTDSKKRDEDASELIAINLQICSLYREEILANEDLHYSLYEPIDVFHRWVLKSIAASADWLLAKGLAADAHNLFEECLLRNPEDAYLQSRIRSCILELA